ncbi:hypothetical protein [Janthinobacterium sp. PC23-8]|uniref:hypothetical protein n=1 Tax=Janthinobacterium sp. PC23-8 TaxID=2012679 RepID=UPI000B961829|nr:hypothetical protein [Janthinobacterium sp. PC23-8]OYO32052.1 hypothetical protein CD932_13645 [Janthinobacterium sp. PC23-8]
MKNLVVTALFAALSIVTAQAAQKHVLSFQPLKGRYAIYGGALGDPLPPSKKDQRIAFWIDGKAARQMFEAMGPDLRNSCAAEGDYRLRQRAEVSCTYDSKDGHHCAFGFDLLTGRRIAGSIC